MSTIQREVRKRGFFGKICKWIFILFQILMIIWLVSYWIDIGQTIDSSDSEAERIGSGIGATIGTSMLLFFWVAGTIVLGAIAYFTKGKKFLITEEVDG